MDNIWVEISKSGRLVFVEFARLNSEVKWWFLRDMEKMHSIIKYEDNFITVKTVEGEVKTLPLNYYPSMSRINSGELVRCKDPALKDIITDCRIVYEQYGFIVCTNRVILCAQIKEYFTQYYGLVLFNGKSLTYDDLIKLNDDLADKAEPREYWCQGGKLRKIEFIEHYVSVGRYEVITAVTGEIYAMDWSESDVRSYGELWVNGDSALLISASKRRHIGRRLYTNFKGKAKDVCFINKHLNILQLLKHGAIINVPDVVSVSQVDEMIELTFIDGKIDKMPLSWIKLKKGVKNLIRVHNSSNRLYFIGEAGQVIDCRYRLFSDQLFNINGVYCDWELIPYPILSKYKLAVNNGALVRITHISKISGTFVINDSYAVLSKYAMDIMDIELNPKSDLFPILITSKSGDLRPAALFESLTGGLSGMSIVFENGDVWPILSTECHYSPDGPYELVPVEDIIHFRGPVYIIRGNYVLFSHWLHNMAIEKIYESFGNFMTLNMFINLICIGKITVYKTSSAAIKSARA